MNITKRNSQLLITGLFVLALVGVIFYYGFSMVNLADKFNISISNQNGWGIYFPGGTPEESLVNAMMIGTQMLGFLTFVGMLFIYITMLAKEYINGGIMNENN